MSLDLEIDCPSQLIGVLDRRESTVRMIGEILPLVIAKYGIGSMDCPAEIPRDPCQISAD